MSMEETIMTLVVKSGQARSAAYEALGGGEAGTVRGSPTKDAGVGPVGDGGP